MRILVLFWVLVLASAGQASETAWVQHDDMLASRIVVASHERVTGEGYLLAWEAKLAPGWKTYWRSPGEAGLPVRVFDSSAELTPMFPLPERFELFGIQTFGYAKQLLLPFRAKADGKGKVSFKVDFMVCKDICVPFTQEYQLENLDMMADGSFHDIRFDAWMAKVPNLVEDIHGMRIENARVTGPVGHQKLIVEVVADCDLSVADVFVESGTMMHFGLPKRRLLENGNRARLTLSAMNSGKPQDLKGKPLRITFTDGHDVAIDRKITVTQ